jgi:hypothetical protein
MATRFVRVDLSDEARDFSPMAIEPGVPMLDRAGANAKIVYRWLGGLTAEPQWEGESVNFFARDDKGGRLEEVICQPASQNDLRTILKDEVAKLRDRLQKARAETNTERLLKRLMSRTVEDLVESPARSDADSYFFRYRDVNNQWRLVWCWGYQRADQEPAPAVVCTDPACNMLFVRRPGRSPKCPSCAALLSLRPVRKTNFGRSLLIGAGLLALLALLLWWWGRPNRLMAEPSTITAPSGSRVAVKVIRPSLFHRDDVSRQALGITLDPSVLVYDQLEGTARLVGAPGSGTVLRFQMGDLKVDVPVTIGPAAVPTKVTIEPATVELGIGTTASLKLIGEYTGGTTVDLTEAAQWKPLNDGKVYAADGFLEGLAPGTDTISAKYRPSEGGAALEATANVSVRDIAFKSLATVINPDPVGVGRGSALQIDAVTSDGKHYSVVRSSKLKTAVEPAELAVVNAGDLEGRHVGKGTLKASFRTTKLASENPFSVTLPAGIDRLTANPEKLAMVVGEIADLNVLSPSSETIKYTSSKPKIVELTADNRVVGRGAGKADITIEQGVQKCTVQVTVTKGEFTSIAIDPPEVVVPVDDATRPRVMGRLKGGANPRRAEISPDLVTVDKKPSPRFADLVVTTMELKGVAPTKPDSQQSLAVHFGKHEAKAPVEVVLAPLDLEILPGPSIDLPVGEEIALHGWANYAGGRRVEVPANRLHWSADKPKSPGVELHGDRVAALKADGGPLSVTADYFKCHSNPVTIKSVAAEPNLKVELQVDNKSPSVGDTGKLTLSATGSLGPVELIDDLGIIESSDPKIVSVDKKSGRYLAVATGEAKLTVKHPAISDSASVVLRVAPPAAERPKAVRIVSDQGGSVSFPVGAKFDDFRVEAEYNDGFTQLVTRKAMIHPAEAADKAPLSADNGMLVGLRPGKTDVSAEFDGVKTTTSLAAVVTADVQADKIVAEPEEVKMLRKEMYPMRAVGYNKGKSIGILNDLPGVSWQSSAPVVKMDGSAANAIDLGTAQVTAKFGTLAATPAAVNVLATIEDRLKIAPAPLHLRVGESVRVGADVQVFRGDLDMSHQCLVAVAPAGPVDWLADNRVLVGRRPGRTFALFSLGDKISKAEVDVSGVLTPIDGDVVVEPAHPVLAQGQSTLLRAYVITKEGARIDRSESAVFGSSNAKSVSLDGCRACAQSPGSAEITVTVPGATKTGHASVTVSDEEIDALEVDPKNLDLEVGDTGQVHVMGRAKSGTYEMFNHPDLKLNVLGKNSDFIRLQGARSVKAVQTGTGAVEVAWHKLSEQSIVTVTNDPVSSLQIEPASQTLHTGEAVAYTVTGMRGGVRRVLTPDNGLQLFSGDEKVATVIDKNATNVGAVAPGRTTVVARMGGQQAEAGLEVVGVGEKIAAVNADPGTVYHLGEGDTLYRDGTHVVESPRIVEHGDGTVDSAIFGGGDTVHVVHEGDHDVVHDASGATIGRVVDEAPTAKVVGLRFDPDRLQMGTNAQPALVRVFEVLADGRDGRDVTADPKLEIGDPSPGDIAKIEKSADGPRIRGLKDGQAQATAKLGDLTAAAPLLIDIGGETAEAGPAGAQLVVSPNPLTLWSGETTRLGSVRLDTGSGEPSQPVEYKVTAAEGQKVVAIEGEQIRAVSNGDTQLTVTAADPKYKGASATVPVQIISPDKLSFEPSELTLKVDEKTPLMVVKATAADGTTMQVPAVIESMDKNVLDGTPESPGCFVGKGLGQTKLRGTYRGVDCFATVSVTGKRFEDVHTTLNPRDQDFDVAIEVLAAASEGELEYRVYKEGETPADTWTTNQAAAGSPEQPGGDQRSATLHSPAMQYGPRGSLYHLVLEARSKGSPNAQKYPLTLQLGYTINRVETPQQQPKEQ